MGNRQHSYLQIDFESSTEIFSKYISRESKNPDLNLEPHNSSKLAFSLLKINLKRQELEINKNNKNSVHSTSNSQEQNSEKTWRLGSFESIHKFLLSDEKKQTFIKKDKSSRGSSLSFNPSSNSSKDNLEVIMKHSLKKSESIEFFEQISSGQKNSISRLNFLVKNDSCLFFKK